jgi:hypothetical protein
LQPLRPCSWRYRRCPCEPCSSRLLLQPSPALAAHAATAAGPAAHAALSGTSCPRGSEAADVFAASHAAPAAHAAPALSCSLRPRCPCRPRAVLSALAAAATVAASAALGAAQPERSVTRSRCSETMRAPCSLAGASSAFPSGGSLTACQDRALPPSTSSEAGVTAFGVLEAGVTAYSVGRDRLRRLRVRA